MATAPSSCNASNIQIVMPTTVINDASYDTLEAMVASCSPSLLQGSPVVTSINMGGGERKRSSMAQLAEEEDEMMMEDELLYTGRDCVYKPEKKRRLSPEQVRRLERSFEVENKLEPERKLELAKELRLHPRQVAVWFQNRRARWKTKQLEKDYDALKLSYTALQAHFDALLHEKQELHHQVVSLRAKLQQGDQYNHAIEISIEKESKLQLLVKVEESSSKDGDQMKKTVDNSHEEKGGAHVTELSKQRDGGGGAGRAAGMKALQELEVSALSGTEGSVVSEAINSPNSIDSGVNSKEDSMKCNDLHTTTNPNYLSSSASYGAAAAAAASSVALKSSSSSGDQQLLGTVFPTILTLDPFMHVKAETDPEDEIYSKCGFILEDQGAFPWWNTTSWA